ncbi:mucin-19-like [Sycon ciliatum]|uniref:mucin-19-like n=1 Tax=Sycon ciliatum TaxID=27933 RepID=UPI0031F66AF9
MTSRLLVTYVRVQPRCGASASSSVVAIGRRLCASSSTSPGVQACEEEDSLTLRRYVDYAAVRAQQELCFDFSDLHVSGDVVLGSMPCMAVLSQHNRQLQDQSCKVFVSDTLAKPDVTIPGDLRPLLRTLLEECPDQLYPIPQGDMERLLQETNLPATPDHHQTVLMEVDPAYATTLAGLSRIADNTPPPPPPLGVASPAAAAAAAAAAAMPAAVATPSVAPAAEISSSVKPDPATSFSFLLPCHNVTDTAALGELLLIARQHGVNAVLVSKSCSEKAIGRTDVPSNAADVDRVDLATITGPLPEYLSNCRDTFHVVSAVPPGKRRAVHRDCIASRDKPIMLVVPGDANMENCRPILDQCHQRVVVATPVTIGKAVHPAADSPVGSARLTTHSASTLLNHLTKTSASQATTPVEGQQRQNQSIDQVSSDVATNPCTQLSSTAPQESRAGNSVGCSNGTSSSNSHNSDIASSSSSNVIITGSSNCTNGMNLSSSSSKKTSSILSRNISSCSGSDVGNDGCSSCSRGDDIIRTASVHVTNADNHLWRAADDTVTDSKRRGSEITHQADANADQSSVGVAVATSPATLGTADDLLAESLVLECGRGEGSQARAGPVSVANAHSATAVAQPGDGMDNTTRVDTPDWLELRNTFRRLSRDLFRSDNKLATRLLSRELRRARIRVRDLANTPGTVNSVQEQHDQINRQFLRTLKALEGMSLSDASKSQQETELASTIQSLLKVLRGSEPEQTKNLVNKELKRALAGGTLDAVGSGRQQKQQEQQHDDDDDHHHQGKRHTLHAFRARAAKAALFSPFPVPKKHKSAATTNNNTSRHGRMPDGYPEHFRSRNADSDLLQSLSAATDIMQHDCGNSEGAAEAPSVYTDGELPVDCSPPFRIDPPADKQVTNENACAPGGDNGGGGELPASHRHPHYPEYFHSRHTAIDQLNSTQQLNGPAHAAFSPLPSAFWQPDDSVYACAEEETRSAHANRDPLSMSGVTTTTLPRSSRSETNSRSAGNGELRRAQQAASPLSSAAAEQRTRSPSGVDSILSLPTVLKSSSAIPSLAVSGTRPSVASARRVPYHHGAAPAVVDDRSKATAGVATSSGVSCAAASATTDPSADHNGQVRGSAIAGSASDSGGMPHHRGLSVSPPPGHSMTPKDGVQPRTKVTTSPTVADMLPQTADAVGVTTDIESMREQHQQGNAYSGTSSRAAAFSTAQQQLREWQRLEQQRQQRQQQKEQPPTPGVRRRVPAVNKATGAIRVTGMDGGGGVMRTESSGEESRTRMPGLQRGSRSAARPTPPSSAAAATASVAATVAATPPSLSSCPAPTAGQRKSGLGPAFVGTPATAPSPATGTRGPSTAAHSTNTGSTHSAARLPAAPAPAAAGVGLLDSILSLEGKKAPSPPPRTAFWTSKSPTTTTTTTAAAAASASGWTDPLAKRSDTIGMAARERKQTKENVPTTATSDKPKDSAAGPAASAAASESMDVSQRVGESKQADENVSSITTADKPKDAVVDSAALAAGDSVDVPGHVKECKQVDGDVTATAAADKLKGASPDPAAEAASESKKVSSRVGESKKVSSRVGESKQADENVVLNTVADKPKDAVADTATSAAGERVKKRKQMKDDVITTPAADTTKNAVADTAASAASSMDVPGHVRERKQTDESAATTTKADKRKDSAADPAASAAASESMDVSQCVGESKQTAESAATTTTADKPKDAVGMDVSRRVRESKQADENVVTATTADKPKDAVVDAAASAAGDSVNAPQRVKKRKQMKENVVTATTADTPKDAVVDTATSATGDNMDAHQRVKKRKQTKEKVVTTPTVDKQKDAVADTAGSVPGKRVGKSEQVKENVVTTTAADTTEHSAADSATAATGDSMNAPQRVKKSKQTKEKVATTATTTVDKPKDAVADTAGSAAIDSTSAPQRVKKSKQADKNVPTTTTADEPKDSAADHAASAAGGSVEVSSRVKKRKQADKNVPTTTTADKPKDGSADPVASAAGITMEVSDPVVPDGVATGIGEARSGAGSAPTGRVDEELAEKDSESSTVPAVKSTAGAESSSSSSTSSTVKRPSSKPEVGAETLTTGHSSFSDSLLDLESTPSSAPTLQSLSAVDATTRAFTGELPAIGIERVQQMRQVDADVDSFLLPESGSGVPESLGQMASKLSRERAATRQSSPTLKQPGGGGTGTTLGFLDELYKLPTVGSTTTTPMPKPKRSNEPMPQQQAKRQDGVQQAKQQEDIQQPKQQDVQQAKQDGGQQRKRSSLGEAELTEMEDFEFDSMTDPLLDEEIGSSSARLGKLPSKALRPKKRTAVAASRPPPVFAGAGFGPGAGALPRPPRVTNTSSAPPLSGDSAAADGSKQPGAIVADAAATAARGSLAPGSRALPGREVPDFQAHTSTGGKLAADTLAASKFAADTLASNVPGDVPATPAVARPPLVPPPPRQPPQQPPQHRQTNQRPPSPQQRQPELSPPASSPPPQQQQQQHQQQQHSQSAPAPVAVKVSAAKSNTADSTAAVSKQGLTPYQQALLRAQQARLATQERRGGAAGSGSNSSIDLPVTARDSNARSNATTSTSTSSSSIGSSVDKHTAAYDSSVDTPTNAHSGSSSSSSSCADSNQQQSSSSSSSPSPPPGVLTGIKNWLGW